MKSIAFQTSCYEKSYRLLLEKDLLRHNLSQFSDVDFEEETVIVNNVVNMEHLLKLADENFTDINFINSQRDIGTVLNYFGLSLEDISKGLFYSIQHFTGIYHTKCDYLFHVSEDCGIDNLDSRFIKESIAMLESNKKYIIAMPRWCDDDDAIERAKPDKDNFFIQYGFTDQIYIIKTKKFKEDIYHYSHPRSARYPAYGGECFEKRIDSFMRCNQYYGIVHKQYIYDSKYYDQSIKKDK